VSPARVYASVASGGVMLAGMITTRTFDVSTKGQGDALDITEDVAAAVTESTLRSGIATVFVVGSTAGVTTIEFEPGAIADLNAVFEDLAPRTGDYQHHLRWGDDNGSSHVCAALLGPSLTVPFTAGTLALGRWQQIMLLEFDTRPRTREMVIQLIGE
jgi:secondary thiamine-phosphate synthase enzyme